MRRIPRERRRNPSLLLKDIVGYSSACAIPIFMKYKDTRRIGVNEPLFCSHNEDRISLQPPLSRYGQVIPRFARSLCLIVSISLCWVTCAFCSPLDEIVGELQAGSISVSQEGKQATSDQLRQLKERMRAKVPEVVWNPDASKQAVRDKLYSPHLRDIVDTIQRSSHVHTRSQAGELSGIHEDACPQSRAWSDSEHETPTCCGVDTSRYAALREDHNFKACCVRRGEEQLSEEEIACRHPDGSGWAGLFEFYFPTQLLEWGLSAGAESIAGGELTDASYREVAPLARGGSFIHANDITLRVNLATMDTMHREALARDLCMHPMQFMKLMDPDPQEDPYQLNPDGHGTAGAQMLKALPLWSTFAKNGALLTRDRDESLKLLNFDADYYVKVGGSRGRATDLALGYERGSLRDPHYCRALPIQSEAEDEDGLRDALEVYGKGISGESKEINTGYTCAQVGSERIPMTPVIKADSRGSAELSERRAVAFLVAGGVYAPAMAEPETRRSFYKRFEPLPYFAFKGKPFGGEGGVNEHGIQCRIVEGEGYYKGAIRADRLHRSSANLSGSYATPMRIFASCPKGWTRWRGPHSELACGEEKLW